MRSLDKYSYIIERVFDDYNIDYFLDEKISIMENPIIILILSILDMKDKNYSYDSVFRYLKSGLTGVSDEDIFLLENYVIANGIKVYLFDRYRPVPVLSFSTRDLNAFMGIMITASHNPKEYNGYKVFDETGLQIGKKVADEVMENINNTNIFNGVKKISEEEFNNMINGEDSLFEIVGEKQERRYLDILKTRILNDKEIEDVKKKIKVVYTPLHGTGDLVVNRLLKELGYENIIPVKEQQEENTLPRFAVVGRPNLELYHLQIQKM